MVIRASLGLVLCLGLIAPAFAQSVEQFYRGREVRLLIGEPPGGGYDLYGRFLARHLSRFLRAIRRSCPRTCRARPASP
jgi:tripartite-type tricarboxylate transporter receptor subunit TctC